MKTIRLAWKALARFRTYTFINILGLALSLACVLIILRYIHQEVTVNHFCKDLENTYLLYIEYVCFCRYYPIRPCPAFHL